MTHDTTTDTTPDTTPRDRLPEIVLRIPGCWSDPAELVAAIPPGFALTPERLTLPDGTSVEFLPLPPDAEFPRVFATACRGELDRCIDRAIRHYTVNACLVGPGGSIEAAARMLAASAAIVRGGGKGVFVDNGLLAHPRDEWLQLADMADIESALLAFVSFVSAEHEISSMGMHAIGRRDAVISRTGRGDADLDDLIGFLQLTSYADHAVQEGDFFCAETGFMLRVNGDASPRYPEGSPVHNPYGHWRLSPETTAN